MHQGQWQGQRECQQQRQSQRRRQRQRYRKWQRHRASCLSPLAQHLKYPAAHTEGARRSVRARASVSGDGGGAPRRSRRTHGCRRRFRGVQGLRGSGAWRIGRRKLPASKRAIAGNGFGADHVAGTGHGAGVDHAACARHRAGVGCEVGIGCARAAGCSLGAGAGVGADHKFDLGHELGADQSDRAGRDHDMSRFMQGRHEAQAMRSPRTVMLTQGMSNDVGVGNGVGAEHDFDAVHGVGAGNIASTGVSCGTRRRRRPAGLRRLGGLHRLDGLCRLHGVRRLGARRLEVATWRPAPT